MQRHRHRAQSLTLKGGSNVPLAVYLFCKSLCVYLHRTSQVLLHFYYSVHCRRLKTIKEHEQIKYKIWFYILNYSPFWLYPHVWFPCMPPHNTVSASRWQRVSLLVCFDFRSISTASPWRPRIAQSWSPWCRAVRKRRTMKGKRWFRWAGSWTTQWDVNVFRLKDQMWQTNKTFPSSSFHPHSDF